MGIRLSSVLRASLFSVVIIVGALADARTGVRAVPGEFIVKFKQPVSPVELVALRSRLLRSLPQRERSSGESVALRSLTGVPNMALMRSTERAGRVLRSLVSRDPLVQYVEPNFIYKAAGLPTDPDFHKSWSFRNTGQTVMKPGRRGADIHVTSLWDKGVTGSSQVIVAVIDTGMDWDHPDLAGNLYTNPGERGEKANNGIDDDGNGYVDDVHGWNSFADNANSRDDAGHGTHVSGIIGALGNNGVGTVGINWNVSILPVKFLDLDGYGTTEGAIEAIEYARKMKARVMNNSWGGDPFSQALYDTIQKAKEDGILFAAAAGNDSENNDFVTMYPASYDISNIVSVAATDNFDALADISNYGVKTVDVAAPGFLIYSTIPGGGYDSYTGTSMATPHVAGIAALMASVDPTLTPEEMIDRLVKTSDQNYELKRKVRSKGRVNAFNAVSNIVPPSLDPDESLWRDYEFHFESEHPYKSAFDERYPINIPGAKFIRLRFKKIETEIFDKITLETAGGSVVETLSGDYADYVTESVKGDTLVLRFKTDLSLEKFGYIIDGAQVVW